MNNFSLFTADWDRMETAFSERAEHLNESLVSRPECIIDFFNEMELGGVFERCGGACASRLAFWCAVNEGYEYLRTQIPEEERAKCDKLLLLFTEPYAFDLPQSMHLLKYGVLVLALSPEHCRQLNQIPSDVSFRYAFDLVATLPDPPLGLMHGPAGYVFSDQQLMTNLDLMIEQWKGMINQAALTNRGLLAIYES